MNRYLIEFYATRRRLQLGIAAASIVAGALLGVALTALGKIVAEAPPATLANFLWNAAVFGVFGLAIGPTIIWLTLRRAPLWRTIVDPLLAGSAAAGIAVVLGWGPGLLVLPPIAVALAALRLERRFPEKQKTLPSDLQPPAP